MITFAIILLLTIWYKHSHRPAPPVTVSVKTGSINEQAEAIGSIVPEHSITVKSQLPGTVKQLFHEAGDYVKKGEKLVEIQPMPTPQEIASAIEAVAADKVNIKTANKQVHNYTYLIKRNMLKATSPDYLLAKEKRDTAVAKLELDQENLELLRDGHTVIDGKPMQSIVVSPVDGYILQSNIDVGDPVTAMGQVQEATALFTIANMHDLIFKGSVDETDAGKLKLGMPATITLGALPNIQLHGKLHRLSLQSATQDAVDNANNGVATATVTTPFNNGFDVEINAMDIPNNLTLRSGYSANASINIQTARNVLTLPERVIVFANNKTYVNLLTDAKTPSKKVPVTLGLTDGSQVEIISGLKAGQQVIDPNPVMAAAAN